MPFEGMYISDEQVQKIGDFLRRQPDKDSTLKFCHEGPVKHDMYPERNHPYAIDFFFFTIMQQFGFWYGNHNGYLKPLIRPFDGKPTKGSDLMWKVCKRALDNEPMVFVPERLREIPPEVLMREIFVDDLGPIPFPDIEARLSLTHAYAEWFDGTVPRRLIRVINDDVDKTSTFIAELQNIPGFSGDPFNKKIILLAMALANRPEHFLHIETHTLDPIIDYHVMRVALRMGLVAFDKMSGDDFSRRWVTAEEEHHVRSLVFEAIKRIIEISGKSMPFVDVKLWLARKYCPEMTHPDCDNCMFQDSCEQHTALFQPVFRTTNY